jgi:hypothetical protein
MPRFAFHATAIFAVATAIWASGSPVRADYIIRHAILQCTANDAIVRHGESHSGEAPIMLHDLPDTMAAKWAGIVIAPQNRCTLANGDVVTLRYGRKQAYAYGRGGGSPDSFFSLWVNRKKVLSREPLDVDFRQSKILNSLTFAQGRILRCLYQTDTAHPWIAYRLPPPVPIACTEQAIDVGKLPDDPFEMSDRDREGIGTLSVASTSNNTFCRQFVRPYLDELGYERIGDVATKAKEALAYSLLNPQLPFSVVVSGTGKSINYVAERGGRSEFDFDNDGTIDTVINVPGPNGRESNALLVKRGGGVGDDVVATIDTNRSSDDFMSLNSGHGNTNGSSIPAKGPFTLPSRFSSFPCALTA